MILMRIQEAHEVEKSFGISVIKHARKKPDVRDDVLNHFQLTQE